MKATEILNNVKELLSISKKETQVEDLIVEEAVDLSTEEKVEIIEEVANYVTLEELSAVKTELLSMIKALIEYKSSVDSKEVPTELSKQEEVEYLLQRIKDILTNG